MRKLDKIIVHCSASKFGDAATIKKWHTDPKPLGNAWDDIGYHYVIKRNGEIELGRPIEQIGAHCFGQNSRSIGICLIGNPTYIGESKVFTDEQMNSLRVLCHTLIIKELLPIDCVRGHNDFSDKVCPGFHVQNWWKLAKLDLEGVEV